MLLYREVLEFNARKLDLLDLGEKISKVIVNSKLKNGFISLCVQSQGAGILLNENNIAFKMEFLRMVKKLMEDNPILHYSHEIPNIRSSFTQKTVVLPLFAGRAETGDNSILFVNFRDSEKQKIVVNILGQ